MRLPGSRPDDERVRRAREQADRLRSDAAAQRRLEGPGGERRAAGRTAGTAVGERVVGGDLGAVLAALEGSGWRVLHDVRRRLARFVTLDHVAVGPPGVVAVQQVPWEGVVTVDDGVLRLDGGAFALETRRVAVATAALAVVVGREVPLRTVLCVVPAEPAPATVRPDVEVVGRAALAAALSARPAVLGPDDVAAVHAALAAALRTASGLRRPRHPPPGPVDDARRGVGGPG